MSIVRVMVAWVLLAACSWAVAGPVGYYRQPALHKETIVFVAEGDLWKVSAGGGVATRLTSHAGEESTPRISPDGQTVAFIGRYEGPTELYTMPLGGGLPVRRTYDGESIAVCGFGPDGKVLLSTDGLSTLPSVQLMLMDVTRADRAGTGVVLPLAQAAEGCFDDAGRTLFFTRLPFQGSHTRRYKGGTAQNLWRFAEGDAEAAPLTKDYAGTSKCPMWWSDRLYFASDRDGTMNLWSMRADGTDLKQHTKHVGWEVIGPAMWGGKIVYQLGADLRIYDIAAGRDSAIKVTLDSDLDQTRENWVNRPAEYITSAHISPNGDRITITARGQVFVAPHPRGRLVEVTHRHDVRCRDARFMPDGKSLLVLSDESGEVELWNMPANGVGQSQQLTSDGKILRWEGVPSPDGKYIVHHDKDQRLFVYDVKAKANRKIDESKNEGFGSLRWSGDSKWLAYVVAAENGFRQIRLYSVASGGITRVTSDRFDSHSPAFGADGKWLYLLSDRNLVSVVGSPWGNYQPEPFLDKKTQIYALALSEGPTRSPFAAKDELQVEKESPRRTASTQPTTNPATAPAATAAVDLAGIEARLIRVPVGAGNYGSLVANDKALFWMSRGMGDRSASLVAIQISNDGPEVKTVVAGVNRFELSGDGKKILVDRAVDSGATTAGRFCIIDAVAGPADMNKKAVDLSRWALSVIPREEWRQMFVEAWRLERDYFYDRGMHGTDWKALLEKYRPLVDRVTTRAELSDLIAQMVSELSALHIFVTGGDVRNGEDRIAPSSLGAVLTRDTEAGGYRVQHIYRSDPDEPDLTSPLARLEVKVKEGDVIEMVNGRSTLSVADVGLLLRNQAGQQVLMRVKSKDGASRDVVVVPISDEAAANLRYHEWEYTRRLAVEEQGKGQIGYVHLRAMGGGNFTEWAKNFYPAWNRHGLIIDVRHNRGGNIDSWILNRLVRKAWFYWSDRFGSHEWNMHYAFRGHIVVLCNERTASDGEFFSEGVKRLKLGTVIGTRTWGGAIWLSRSNVLVDQGVASAAEFGTFGPEGEWLIEGHGVDPDIVVDNPPHATFKGEDAQLVAAIEYLQKKIKDEPIKAPQPPKFPDKSGR